MDLIILVVLSAIVLFMYKSFNSFVYFLAISDIALRIISFLQFKFGVYVEDIAKFVRDVIPENIPSIIDKYSTGIFNEILMIGYVIVFILFEVYIIKVLFKKRRR